jgi:hypothetical protein
MRVILAAAGDICQLQYLKEWMFRAAQPFVIVIALF